MMMEQQQHLLQNLLVAHSGKGKGNKKTKETAKEKKEKQNQELKPIIQELAYEITDFGAGFHKPTWKDLPVFKIAQFPVTVTKFMIWQSKYIVRRIQKLPLNDEEKQVLTERAVGHVTWEISSEEERTEMISRELWILDNLAEYKEEQEFKKLSKGEQKYYQKMMKRKGSRGAGGGPGPMDFKED